MPIRYGNKLVVNVYLDDETYEALDLLAKAWAVPRSRIIVNVLKEFLEMDPIKEEVERLRQEMRRLEGYDGQEKD